jgi:bis(5'-nucleosyl)-tetraphosphatase (symmetrical)
MAKYIIGDVQGCFNSLQQLLHAIEFSPSRDHIYFLGDVINRGSGSLPVLRFLYKNSHAVTSVLGNHDVHLLAVANNVRRSEKGDTLAPILHASDKNELLCWLSNQPLAIHVPAPIDMLLVHAGLLPSWTLDTTLRLARELELVLRGENKISCLQNIFSNTPIQWCDELVGIDRLRVIMNVLTRLRFCSAQGEMDFHGKGDIHTAKTGFLPWFDVPNRASSNVSIAFGHWASLGGLTRDKLFALDTGCVWGGLLTALRLDESGRGQHEKIQVIGSSD